MDWGRGAGNNTHPLNDKEPGCILTPNSFEKELSKGIMASQTGTCV